MSKLKNTAPPPAYRRLGQALAGTGWIALGSLVERTTPGGGGPRYQWSRRVGSKTVTVALSAEPFAWLKTAIRQPAQSWADAPANAAVDSNLRPGKTCRIHLDATSLQKEVGP